MAAEEFDTGFGTGRREVGTNEASLVFSPSLAEQMLAYYKWLNERRARMGGLLLDALDERNQTPELEGMDVIGRVADETGEAPEVVQYAWIVLYARGEVVQDPGGRSVTARSLQPAQPE